MEEIEVKFLDIDVPNIEEKLLKLGALKVGDFFYRRKSYDFPDYRLAKEYAWVRIRDEGTQVTMTFKQRINVGENKMQDGGMKEIEIVISNFQAADDLLKAIGLIEKFYEENKRTRYVLGSTEFDIDTWPLLNPYLEIEGQDWDTIKTVSNSLGFDWNEHKKCSTMQIYEMNGIDENSYSVLTFETQIKK